MLQNRYRIEDLVGCGGYGAVYLAIDTRSNVPVAIKENLQLTAIQQFVTEAKLLANLNHPNLPRVRDYFVEPTGRQYLVMDFIRGRTLYEIVLAKRLLSERELLNLLRGVFDAVIYLHSQNPPVIHRDIKPQNIIVTAEGKAVLVDFGIAKVGGASATTSTGARGVTPGFAPIEQYGIGRTDERSDIYALGATLYFCLTGRIPPPTPDLAAGTTQLLPVRYLNRSVSVAVANAIEKAMALQQSLRFASVKEFWQELNNITTALEPEPTYAPKPIPVPKTSFVSPASEISPISSRGKDESHSASSFPPIPRTSSFSPVPKSSLESSVKSSVITAAILSAMWCATIFAFLFASVSEHNATSYKDVICNGIFGGILGAILGAFAGAFAR